MAFYVKHEGPML